MCERERESEKKRWKRYINWSLQGINIVHLICALFMACACAYLYLSYYIQPEKKDDEDHDDDDVMKRKDFKSTELSTNYTKNNFLFNNQFSTLVYTGLFHMRA